MSSRCCSADHVVVAVARELHPQAVAGLGRLAVADAVGQDDVVLRDVEQLARAEELAGELRLQELRAAAARAVQHQDALRTTPCASFSGDPSVR